MIQGNYEQIIKMISDNANLPLEDIERRIEAKRAKLSGLISKEGAAQIIASELGISFDKQKLKISNLLDGMRRINIVGKIFRINKIVEYNKNGKSGKIGSFFMADDTGNIRVVLWDTNHIGLLERQEIKEGDTIEISNADIRNNELHLSGFADLKMSNKALDNVKTEITIQKKNIIDSKINDNVALRAFVVQIFGPNFFNVCPECGKKVSETSECEKHGKVISKRNAILNLILDDGTESLRTVLFGDMIKKLVNETEIPDAEQFMLKRDEIMGSELLVEGNIRKNKLNENPELYCNNVSTVNLDTLITELEK